ncbi:MAG: hypothetical protein WC346_17260 [Methanogenium sp.]|jgi:hypothetical protein
MASTAKTILGVVPGLMATNLVVKSIPNMNRFGKPSKKRKGKTSQRILPKGYISTLVSVPLIGAVSTEINKLS